MMMRDRPMLSIRLHRRTVRVDVTWPDHQTAIEVFDQILASARREGSIDLVVNAPGEDAAEAD